MQARVQKRTKSKKQEIELGSKSQKGILKWGKFQQEARAKQELEVRDKSDKRKAKDKS
jgi:hypothetical protein